MNTKKMIIGVMGPGNDATPENIQDAYELGTLIAQHDFITLSGGRNVGVMDAVSRGANDANGVVVGIIPSDDRSIASTGVQIPVLTNMSDARNNINVLTSDAIIVCGMNPGTASEAALAIKWKKPLFFLKPSQDTVAFFSTLQDTPLNHTQTPQETLSAIVEYFKAM